MTSTYIDLTNKLLRRLNEVEISQSDFPSVVGLQATAKDCIFDAVSEINNAHNDWPFNAVEHTQKLSVGVGEYAWPLTFTLADWGSFQLQKDVSLEKHKSLRPISRDEWYKYLRDNDYDAGTNGSKTPELVFPSHGQGFGVSPNPDKEYTLKYRYYRNPTELVLFSDEVSIPSKFDYVIIAGALYHLNLFKENAEAADRAEQKFQRGIQDMVRTFLPNPDKMWATQVNVGGGSRKGLMYNPAQP